MTDEKSSEGVRAVDRALEILMAFHADDRSLTASELLKRVDLSRPTMYRLLRTLELKGFVVSSGEPQRFQLGASVAHLAHVWTSGLDLPNAAAPTLRLLWEATGETVALQVQQGMDRVCVAELPSPQPLSFKRGVGHREKITRGASGKAMLAFSGNINRYLDELVPSQQRSSYREELDRIKTAGYAVSKDELIQGAVAVAAPFFTAGNCVLGTLAVYGPSARMNDATIGKTATLVMQAAQALSHTFGARAASP